MPRIRRYGALRAAVIADLTARSGDLAQITTVTTAEPMPALALAYRLYGDATRYDDLVARADTVSAAVYAPQFRGLVFMTLDPLPEVYVPTLPEPHAAVDTPTTTGSGSGSNSGKSVTLAYGVDEVRLVVNGGSKTGWQRVVIVRGIELMPSTFTVQVTDRYGRRLPAGRHEGRRHVPGLYRLGFGADRPHRPRPPQDR